MVTKQERLYKHLLKLLQTLDGSDKCTATVLNALRFMRRDVHLPDSGTRAVISLLQHGLALLNQDGKPKWATLLEARFFDGTTPNDFAVKTGFSVEKVQRDQRLAINQMASLFLAEEARLRRPYVDRLLSQLEARTYDELIGTEKLEAKLKMRLVQTQNNPLTIVSGIGGIGKTAAVDKVVRSAIADLRYDHVVWLRYESISMSGKDNSAENPYIQLVERLASQPHIAAAGLPTASRDQLVADAVRQIPHLVVIDNIEDPKATAYLQTRLPAFFGNSHFLITSRAFPENEMPTYGLLVNELTHVNSLALLRHVALQNNQADFAALDDTQLDKLIELVGGNPLALKLAVSMSRSMSFVDVLQALRSGSGKHAAGLYHRLYRNIWGTMTQEQQLVLAAMRFVPGDTTIDYLQKISRLKDGQLLDVIEFLRERSLIEPRGNVKERRYGIHRTTAAFLRQQLG